jgi:hypothetical protein
MDFVVDAHTGKVVAAVIAGAGRVVEALDARGRRRRFRVSMVRGSSRSAIRRSIFRRSTRLRDADERARSPGAPVSQSPMVRAGRQCTQRDRRSISERLRNNIDARGGAMNRHQLHHRRRVAGRRTTNMNAF